MFMNRFRFVLATSFLLAGSMFGAQAGVVSYNTEAAFDAATTGLTSYDIPLPLSGVFQDVSTSFAIGPITFGATRLLLWNDGGYGVGQTYLAGAQSDLTASLSGATAVSFQLGTYTGPDSVDIYVNGVFVTTVTESAGHPSSLFIGFTDTVPITEVTFHNQSLFLDHEAEMDVLNFAVGTSTVVSPVPEPITLSLFGVGLVGAAAMRRRHKAQG